jgi:hypothetical protein
MRFRRPARLTATLAAALAAAPAPLPAQQAAADSPGLACADQPRLEAEHQTVKSEIASIALSGSDRRDRRRAAGAGKIAAGTAAGLLLPFGIGLALRGSMMLAEQADKKARAKRPPPPAPVAPDVPALIERQYQLEQQLAELAENGCPASGARPSKPG